MSEISKTKPAFKVWLETDEGYVFGPGVYSLLKKVRETGTLKEAAGSLGMSYRFAWGLVKKAEEKLGQPLLHSHKGGRDGGGSTELTDLGMQFLENFSKIVLVVNELSREPGLLEQFLSRNQIEAEVKEIQTVGNRVDLTLQITDLTHLRVSASKKMVERMDISVGDRVNAELTSMTVKIHKT